MVTAAMLFAGGEYRHGLYRCFYCGADCDDTHLTKTYVKETFTNLDIVRYPGSSYVCEGCVQGNGNGLERLEMLDGAVRVAGEDGVTERSLAPRMYSWLITQDKRVAFTKAHIALIRDILTDKSKLPEPPFAVILADSGQKQLIFRAPVAHNKDVFDVLLEDMRITVNVDVLRERLELAASISTVMGKPALKDKFTFNAYIQARKSGIPIDALEKWQEVQHEPISQLAAWLAPSKLKKGKGE